MKTTCTSWCKQYSRQCGAPPLPPALPHAPKPAPSRSNKGSSRSGASGKNGKPPDPPRDKTAFNKAAKNLKQFLYEAKQQGIQAYLRNLTATDATDYSLWKATRGLKRPQTISPLRTVSGDWAKSDAQKTIMFADHFTSVFCPYPSVIPDAENHDILRTLTAPGLPTSPVKPFTIAEVHNAILRQRTTKSPGFDLINGKVLHELPAVGVRAITYLYNSILRTGYFPAQWKVSQIIPILKPGETARRSNLLQTD